MPIDIINRHQESRGGTLLDTRHQRKERLVMWIDTSGRRCCRPPEFLLITGERRTECRYPYSPKANAVKLSIAGFAYKKKMLAIGIDDEKDRV